MEAEDSTRGIWSACFGTGREEPEDRRGGTVEGREAMEVEKENISGVQQIHQKLV